LTKRFNAIGRPYTPLIGAVGYREEVVDQVKLGVARAGEEHFVWVGDRDLAAFDLQHGALARHDVFTIPATPRPTCRAPRFVLTQ